MTKSAPPRVTLTPLAADWIKKLEGIHGPLLFHQSGGCCDGNNLAAVGLPNLDTMGVRGGNPHSPDEYLVVSSLVERAQLLTNILAHLSDNGFK